MTGYGTIIATDGIATRIAADFAGTIDVPSGMTLAIPSALSRSVSFTGAGELILDSADRITGVSGFAGKIVLPSGLNVEASDTSLFKHHSTVLSDGCSLDFTEKALAWGSIVAMPDWNTEGAWSFNANNTRLSAVNSSYTLDDRPPFVMADGSLRLVNGPAQSHTALPPLGVSFVRLTDYDYRRVVAPDGPLPLVRLPNRGKGLEGRFHPTYASAHDARTTEARAVPQFLRGSVMYQENTIRC